MPQTQPDGYLAFPPTGKGSGVLVLHAWWGLNDTIRGFCDRLAQAGFVVFAPDLYHGQVTDTIPGAEALSGELFKRYPEVKAEVLQDAGFLNELVGSSAGLAVIGFSMGTTYALELADAYPDRIRAVVVFYGSWAENFSQSRAAYQGHFAENDPFEPQSGVDALEAELKAAGRPAEFYVYPGTGHWFFEPDRVDAYDAQAAELAWERTLEFLRRSTG